MKTADLLGCFKVAQLLMFLSVDLLSWKKSLKLQESLKRRLAMQQGLVTSILKDTRYCLQDDEWWTQRCRRSLHGRPSLWLGGKESAPRAEGPGFESHLRQWNFSGPSRTSDLHYKVALQWLPCQAPGVIGSTLGLVGPVSVFCDWVR